MRKERGHFHILMVEDDLGDAGLIKLGLLGTGFELMVHHAKSGEDGLVYLSENQTNLPDLILLDLSLPGKSGHEVLGEIKTSEALRKIPVVVLSTSGEPNDVERAYDLGANSFMTKAMELEDFKKSLAATCTFWFETVQLPLCH